MTKIYIPHLQGLLLVTQDTLKTRGHRFYVAQTPTLVQSPNTNLASLSESVSGTVISRKPPAELVIRKVAVKNLARRTL